MTQPFSLQGGGWLIPFHGGRRNAVSSSGSWTVRRPVAVPGGLSSNGKPWREGRRPATSLRRVSRMPYVMEPSAGKRKQPALPKRGCRGSITLKLPYFRNPFRITEEIFLKKMRFSPAPDWIHPPVSPKINPTISESIPLLLSLLSGL